MTAILQIAHNVHKDITLNKINAVYALINSKTVVFAPKTTAQNAVLTTTYNHQTNVHHVKFIMINVCNALNNLVQNVILNSLSREMIVKIVQPICLHVTHAMISINVQNVSALNISWRINLALIVALLTQIVKNVLPGIIVPYVLQILHMLSKVNV